MPTRITTNSSDGPSAMLKKYERAATEAMRAVGETWREEMLPEHFTIAGGKKYEYQPRWGEGEPAWVPNPKGIVLVAGKSKYGRQRVVQNKKYWWEKERLGFGETPLVYTGESQESAIETAHTVIKKGAGTVTAEVRMDVPQYFFQRATRSDGTMSPDKVAELQTIAFDEQRYLAHVAEETVAAMLRTAPVRESRAA